MTEEERHEIAVMSGRKGGKSLKKRGKKILSAIRVEFRDRDVFKAWSKKHHNSMTELLHAVAESLIRNDPSLKPDNWDKNLKEIDGVIVEKK